MSVYQFAPAIATRQHLPFVTWDDGFTTEEVERIRAYGDSLALTKAVIDQRSEKEDFGDIRQSKVGWISNNPDTNWLYDRLAFITRQLNAKFYNFDLFGFCEDMQYTTYDAQETGHYTWHVDMTETALAPRKFSLVVQLSDPAEYEGGDLQIFTQSVPIDVDKKKGLIAAFPSWALHRVTPITSGTRRSLVVWVCGPSFR